MAIELNIEMLTALVDQVKAIDAKLETVKGTISQRRTIAVAKLSAAEATLIADHDLSDGIARPYLPVTNLARAESNLEAAKVAYAEAKQAVDDAVVAALKASKSDSSTEVDALKAQRAELVTSVDAMRQVLTTFKVDVSSVPDVGRAPRTGGGSGSSGKSLGSTTGAHYVVKPDGSKFSYQNDTFSGLAFYAFKNGGAEELAAALTAAGVTNRTQEWEAEVTVNGITRTVGMRILEDTTGPAIPGTVGEGEDA